MTHFVLSTSVTLCAVHSLILRKVAITLLEAVSPGPCARPLFFLHPLPPAHYRSLPAFFRFAQCVLNDIEAAENESRSDNGNGKHKVGAQQSLGATQTAFISCSSCKYCASLAVSFPLFSGARGVQRSHHALHSPRSRASTIPFKDPPPAAPHNDFLH